MNAEELIIRQYELVKQKGQHSKAAKGNYQKCVLIDRKKTICLEKLIAEIQGAGKHLDSEQFDNAVIVNCCEFCQAGWKESKSVKEIKKNLKGLKLSMHALAKCLLKKGACVQPVSSGDSQGRAV